MDSSAYEVDVEPGVVPDSLEAFRVEAQAHFFQSPAWVRLVPGVLAHMQPWVPCVRDAQQRVLALLPLFSWRRWGVWRLVGGPWGTYGGILSHDPQAARVLLRWFETHTRSASLVRIHDFTDSLAAGPLPWKTHAESCQLVNLPHDPQQLFDHSFTSQNRNKIRKAEKNGVEVSLHTDATSLGTYADLYDRLARRLQVSRPMPRRLFEALAHCDGVEVWLARHEGDCIAGLLNLNWGGQIMNWGNVSSPESWKFAPNNLLHWKALQHACLASDGPRVYNFGSSAVSEKVHAFKKSFGAVDHAYVRRERVATWWRLLQRLRGRPS